MASSTQSGTQSPPLEATGSHIPMGVSSIHGWCSEAVKDIEQRAEYFSEAVKEHITTLLHGEKEPAESQKKEPAEGEEAKGMKETQA